MNGLELSKGYYKAYGEPTIEKEFYNFKDRIAVGLVGEGSECFGFDDNFSTDHDFEPAFCLWLTKNDYETFGFALERMYAKLPKEFAGFKRLSVSPVGGSRHGVMVIDDFYNKFLGTPCVPSSLEQWLYLPSSAIASACNGEVFSDKLGEFSKIRNTLLAGYPQDVRRKKIAAHLTMMLQTGLYNYNRSIKRHENGAAQLCVFEFVRHTISIIYLLNNKYEPFYKWAYKGMRTLKILSELEGPLSSLTELGNTEIEAAAKSESIEEICKLIVDELKNQGLTKENGYDLQKHAVSVQNKISDYNLRNMHILGGI